jgi:hypothetical protein
MFSFEVQHALEYMVDTGYFKVPKGVLSNFSAAYWANIVKKGKQGLVITPQSGAHHITIDKLTKAHWTKI